MIRVTAAVIERDGKLLVARRRAEDRFGGVFEFPGGKIEPGESPEDCLRREIAEELGLEIEVGERLGRFPFVSEALSIELIAFRAAWTGGKIVLHDHSEVRWVPPDELVGLLFAEPDLPLVRLLAGKASLGR